MKGMTLLEAMNEYFVYFRSQATPNSPNAMNVMRDMLYIIYSNCMFIIFKAAFKKKSQGF